MEKTYTIEQIKAYGTYWLASALSMDSVDSIPENVRLSAFIHYIDDEFDSDSMERFLKSSKYGDCVKRSRDI